MRDALLLLVVLAATRSFAVGIFSQSNSGLRPDIPAEMEYQALLIVIFCLTGFLVILILMICFPGFGQVLVEYNQI